MFPRISISSCFGRYNYVVCSAVFIVFLNKKRKRIPSGVHPCFLTGGHSGKTVPEIDCSFLCWGKEPAVK